MKIEYCRDYEEMSRAAFDSFYDALKQDSKLSICVATGHSPTGVYERMAKNHQDEPERYTALQVVQLDEWFGLSSDDPSSCAYYIENKILLPLAVSNDRYLSFKSDATEPEAECMRVQKELNKRKPIDICFLGLGKNGHLGFNEPAATLSDACHRSTLSETSVQHSMTKTMKHNPKFGLTVGMADILRSKKIILLVTGAGKELTLKQLLTQKVTSQFPASFLWNHPQVVCYIDSESI